MSRTGRLRAMNLQTMLRQQSRPHFRTSLIVAAVIATHLHQIDKFTSLYATV